MVELVRYMAQALVEKPEAMDVRAVENEDSVTIELHVDPDDMGKVIGKQGRIAKAVRMIVKSASAHSEKPVFVEIM